MTPLKFYISTCYFILLGNPKKIISPTSGANSNLKNNRTNSTTKTNILESKTKSTASNRLSRCDEKSEPIGAIAGARSHVVRPTSLPYRGMNTMPAKKSVQVPPRASSMSLNRRAVSGKLQHNNSK